MKTLLKVILLACLWGPSYLFIKLAVQEIPPLTIQIGRIGFAAVILGAVVWFRSIALPRDGRTWLLLTVMGCIGSAIPFSMFAIGEQYIDSALAAVINGVVPAIAAIMAHCFIEEEALTRRKVAGVLVGLSGFLLLLAPTVLDGTIEGDTVGIVCIFIACLSYGSSMVFARKYLSNLPPLVAPAGQLLTATLYIVPLALVMENPLALPMPGPVAIGSILFLSVMGTACAFVVYYNIIQTAGATAVSSVAYLLPVIGALLGMVVRGEVLGTTSWLSFGVILVGMYLINGEQSSGQAVKCGK